jgi:hypothetical protein
MFDSIPDGWFLYALKDFRTGIKYRGDVHSHLFWQCELQWADGGGRLCDGTGETPEAAIAAAVEEVKRRWPAMVATSR